MSWIGINWHKVLVRLAVVSVAILSASWPAEAQPSGGQGLITCTASATPAWVDALGTSELTGSILLACNNLPPNGGGDQSKNHVTVAISVSLNVNVTNPTAANVTGAVLEINGNTCASPSSIGSTFDSCGAPNPTIQDPQFGVQAAVNRVEWISVDLPVPGSSISGSVVADCSANPGACFPSMTTVLVRGIRANAAQLGIGAVPQQVGAFVSAAGPTAIPVTNNVLSVALTTLNPLNGRIGVYSGGSWQLDRGGDGTFDPPNDAAQFGLPGAEPVTGDWNGDGRDEVGVFKDGFWYLDYDGDGQWDGGVADRQHEFGWAGVTPLVGDWNGDGRDTIGIFINGFWFLDANGSGVWNSPGADIAAEFGFPGVTPLVGDWNGDGRDKIGIFLNGFWYLDYDGSGAWNGPTTDRQAEFGWAGVTPLVADWNGDGRKKIGIFANGFWFLDYNGSALWDGPATDRQSEFGWTGVTPLAADWNGDGPEKMGIFIDGQWYLDYDGSGAWDGGVVDKAFNFGQAGDEPRVGRW